MGEANEPPRHIMDSDEKRLNELGYKQEYKRVMSPFQQWAYTFSYTAPLGFITGTHIYNLHEFSHFAITHTIKVENSIVRCCR